MPARRKKTSTKARSRRPSSRPKTRKKGSRKSSGKKRSTIYSMVIAAVVIALIAIWIFDPMLYVRTSDYILRYYRYATIKENKTFESTSPQPVIRTEENYGAEIEKLAAQFNLNAEFLKALIILECSGLKHVKPRFERHIYRRLENVRSGKLDRFENTNYLKALKRLVGLCDIPVNG